MSKFVANNFVWEVYHELCFAPAVLTELSICPENMLVPEH